MTQTTGALGSSITDNAWYDAGGVGVGGGRGPPIATAGTYRGADVNPKQAMLSHTPMPRRPAERITGNRQRSC